MLYPSKDKFIELCKDYRVVPVTGEYHADTETPITIYAKLSGSGYSFLLESVVGGQKLGRYSFIGIDPFMVYSYADGINVIEENGSARRIEGDPFVLLEDLMEQCRGPELKELPRFYGGAVGYLGYDMVRCLENLPGHDKKQEVPDSVMIFPEVVVIFDHIRQSLRLVVNVRTGSENAADYDRAVQKIEKMYRKITAAGGTAHLQESGGGTLASVKTNMTDEYFMQGVERAKEYIRAGDILQVVLSRRLEIPFGGDPFNAYRRLRRNNPSPYMYYLDFGETVIAGSSPEMLVRVEGNTVENRPIAGTRPRSANPEEDLRLAEELLADPKERAEHVMLVDLGRNDVGKVSAPGMVEVPQFMEVERYSHVMHLVSLVRGTLKQGAKGLDALKSCFPAGTVSGAPKVRAMQIIDEIEKTRRGLYAGAVGYIGFNGNIDTAIAIRTVLFRDGIAYLQVGAGIVADSQPHLELEETNNKAGAVVTTLAEEECHIAVNY
ncbi:MAG: anthranilate synthase [Peptococcaceae bacterium BRH_c4b]|nr:MAG: anthranilate synthase [Peptococcaceae bacterium BRH_c4b]